MIELFFEIETFKSLKEVMESFSNIKNFRSRKKVMQPFFSIKNFKSHKKVMGCFFNIKNFKRRKNVLQPFSLFKPLRFLRKRWSPFLALITSEVGRKWQSPFFNIKIKIRKTVMEFCLSFRGFKSCRKVTEFFFSGHASLSHGTMTSHEMLNIFELSRVWENIESWLVYANKVFWISQPYFSTDIIKRS